MVEVLPKWNGDVIGAMHRIRMSSGALAYCMGVNRRYVSKILNSEKQTEYVKDKVEAAIRSFMEERGIVDDGILPDRKEKIDVPL